MPEAPQQADQREPQDAPPAPLIAAVIVLAAGAGTRMRSQLPKVLHPIAGRPLLWHALSAAAGLRPQRLVTVLGHGRERVQDFLTSASDLPPITTVTQPEQKGTGHAVACGLAALTADGASPSGTVIVTYGDVPLLRTSTLLMLAQVHAEQANAVTVLTARVADPSGYGRVVRDGAGVVTGIVEDRDADDEQRAITEINSGVYAFDAGVLAGALPRIGAGNAQGEQYLPDVVGLASNDGARVGTVTTDELEETEGVNDRVQLAQLARVLNDRIVRRHQLAGVTIHDPATTWIHADVVIGQDTEILPGSYLFNGTTIGAGARIGPEVTLSACAVGDGASVVRAHCVDSEIGARATVGPYASLRQQAALADRVKIGTFVEVKKSSIGAGSKVPHLAYLGDATVGARSNIGAGAITANYDGATKSPTIIGEGAFVGTNSTLVAPVTVADGAYVAAGSTVTDRVPPGALGIARSRQYVSEGWVQRRRSKAERPAQGSAAAGEPAAGAADGADAR